MDAFKNFAISEVATAPSPAVSGTSLTVKAGQGSRFPAVPFNVSIWPKNTLPDPVNAEIVRVTARATDVLTITRAQEGSAARTIIIGDLVAASITEKMITDLAATTPATTPGGASGQVQVNDGGAFYGDGNLTYDKATGQLRAAALRSEGPLVVVGATSLNGTLATAGGVSVGGELSVPAGSLTMAGLLREAGRSVPMGYSAAWTPAWHADMQLGTSTQTAEVTRVGSMVFWSLQLVVQPGAYLVPSALVVLTLPTAYLAQHPIQSVGEGAIYVNGVAYYKIGTRAYDGTRVLLIDDATMGQVGNNVPYPDWFVSGSRIFLKGWYQENGY